MSAGDAALLELFHCAETRSMRSLWLLHELSIPFALVDLPFDITNLRAPAYLSVHPLGRVPCLKHDALTLFESGAITQYLCETFDPAELGRPQGNPERPHWLQWVHYAETIAVHAAALVQQLCFIEASQRSSVVWKLESRRRLEKSIGVVDQVVATTPFLLADGFSAADVSVGYSVHLAHRFVDWTQFPNAAAYYERLKGRTAFQRSLPPGSKRPLVWLASFGAELEGES